MLERRCCRCRDAILPGKEFYSQDGEDSEDVYCLKCIDYALEHEWFALDLDERAEAMGFGVYVDEPEKETNDAPIPGQLDMFGCVVE